MPEKSAMKRGTIRTLRLPLPFVLLACIAILVVSIRPDSLWMDEGQSWDVIRGSWARMFHGVLSRGNAVSGMPLYFVLEYAWCRVFGLSEYAMRSLNLLFGGLALWGFVRLVRLAGCPHWTLLFFAFHSVLLRYMDEVRPYVALCAAGAWCLAFLVQYARHLHARDLLGFILCFWAGCAFQMMFVFVGTGYLCLMGNLVRQGKTSLGPHVRAWLLCSPLFLLLAVHYLRFVSAAPEVNSDIANPVASFLHIGYYGANFAGLGWTWEALRARQLVPTPRIAAGLAAAAAAYSGLAVCFIRFKSHRNPAIFRLGLGLFCTFAAFAAGNLALGTLFLVRHAIFLLPAWCLFLAMVSTAVLHEAKDLWPKAVVWAFLAVYAYSAISFLARKEYRKEDCRGAVAAARAFHADHVFWQGADEVFAYYGLESENWETALAREGPPEGDVAIRHITPDALDELLARTKGSVVLLLSPKSDYDRNGVCARFATPDAISRPPFVIIPPRR
jgi:hypothetical protein